MRAAVDLYLSEYRKELADQQEHFNAQMATSSSGLDRQSVRDPAEPGGLLPALEDVSRAIQIESDLIEMPKIMVHSGSMTEDDLEKRYGQRGEGRYLDWTERLQLNFSEGVE